MVNLRGKCHNGYGGVPKVTLADGTGASSDVTISGMTAKDELVSVLSFTTASSIASVADRTSEYTVAAGKMTKSGTDERGNQLIIFWVKMT
jgi:hypothetical protein